MVKYIEGEPDPDVPSLRETLLPLMESFGRVAVFTAGFVTMIVGLLGLLGVWLFLGYLAYTGVADGWTDTIWDDRQHSFVTGLVIWSIVTFILLLLGGAGVCGLIKK